MFVKVALKKVRLENSLISFPDFSKGQIDKLIENQRIDKKQFWNLSSQKSFLNHLIKNFLLEVRVNNVLM